VTGQWENINRVSGFLAEVESKSKIIGVVAECREAEEAFPRLSLFGSRRSVSVHSGDKESTVPAPIRQG
jgi:hypothetical protein